MKKSKLLSVLLLASALTLAGCNSGSDTSSTSSSSSTDTSQPTSSSTTAVAKEETGIEVNAPAKVSFRGTVDLDQYVSVTYDDGSKDKAFTATLDQTKTTAEVTLAGHVLTLGGEGSITVKLASKNFEATFKTTAESATKAQIISELSELTDYAVVDLESFTFIAYHNAKYEFFRTEEHSFSGTALFASGLAYDGSFEEDPDTGAFAAPTFKSYESILYDQELTIAFDALVPDYNEQADMEYAVLPADAEPLYSWADCNIQEVFYYATGYDIEDVIPAQAELGDLWIIRQENEGIVSYGLGFNYTADEPGMITLLVVGGAPAVLANVEAVIEGDDPAESPFPYEEVEAFLGAPITDELPEFSGVSEYEVDDYAAPAYLGVYAYLKSNVDTGDFLDALDAAMAESDFIVYDVMSGMTRYQAPNDGYLVLYYEYTDGEVDFIFFPVPSAAEDNFPNATMAAAFEKVFQDLIPDVPGAIATGGYTPDLSYMPNFYVDVELAEAPTTDEGWAELIATYGALLETNGFTQYRTSGTKKYYLSAHSEFEVSMMKYNGKLDICVSLVESSFPEHYVLEVLGVEEVANHLPAVTGALAYGGTVGTGYGYIYAYTAADQAETALAAYIAALEADEWIPYSTLNNGAVVYTCAEYSVAVWAPNASQLAIYIIKETVQAVSVTTSFPAATLLSYLQFAMEDESYEFGEGHEPVGISESATYFALYNGRQFFIVVQLDAAPEGGIASIVSEFNAANVAKGFVQYGSTKWYDSADGAYYFGATALNETTFAVVWNLN